MNIKNARVTLNDIKKCAIEAGIYPYWFIAFGTLLGCCRPTPRYADGKKTYALGIMEHDDDMDVGILSEFITKEQEDKYVDLLYEAGMFTKREESQRREDTDRLLWLSMRREPTPEGIKCCNWFFYRWGGMLWHSKGKNWLSERKFPSAQYPHQQSDAAMAKGLPENMIAELYETEFEGGLYNVPVLTGNCLDFWYPCWHKPRKGGASRTEYIMKIGRWDDEKSYRIY